jgi:tetratricopeptide (TPR) repeat protein
MKRTPTAKDINDYLDNVGWENLCSQICAEEFSASRVEDSNGKGNGLDAYKILEDNDIVIGYQFKKYKGDFGSSQIETLRKNIKLASEKFQCDFEKPINKFVVIFNLNLDPSHRGAEGSLKQFESKITQWAKEHFNIQVQYLDLNWVHTKLLKYPYLCPELFEINLTVNEFKSEMEPMKKMLSDLIDKSKENKLVDKLIQESFIHYNRAKDGNYLKRINDAIQNLKDAYRLIELDGECINVSLKGRILTCLSGMYVLMHKDNNAIAYAKEALSLLEEEEEVAFCKGNWAFALIQGSGDLKLAEELLLDVLDYFERTSNSSDIIRTFTHLLQIYINQNRTTEVIGCSAKLNLIIEEAIESNGCVTDVHLSAKGVIGNSFMYLGDCGEDNYYKYALDIFTEMMRIYKDNGIEYMYFKVKSAKAALLCRMEREQEGKMVFDDVINEIMVHLRGEYNDGFYQILAINLFNKAFMINGLQESEKRITLLEAEKLYLQLGDIETVEKIRNELRQSY